MRRCTVSISRGIPGRRRRLASEGGGSSNRRTARATLVGAAWGMSMIGCADYAVTVDPAGGLPDVIVASPSFRTDIQPIFEARCATGGCHSALTHQAGLVLTPDAAYTSLVNVRATLGSGALRVVPGNAGASWLMVMIGPNESPRGGVPRMPLAGVPLTPNQITTIGNWIGVGAPRGE
jgi:hypothetical protein